MSNKTDTGDLHMDKKEKQEELNRLYRMIYEKDQEFEKAKGKRMIITTLGFAAFYFWLLSALEGTPTGIDVLYAIVGAIFLAGIHVWINSLIFGYLANKGRSESEALDFIRKRIRELENN
jgi:uncharacterized membrane protein (DUF106 family)